MPIDTPLRLTLQVFETGRWQDAMTLVHIEHGEGNQTLKSLNAVFRPFGLRMGVVKVRRDL